MLCIVVQLCGKLVTKKRHISKLSLHYQLK